MYAVRQTIGVSLVSESKTLQLRMHNFDELRLKVRNCFGNGYSPFIAPVNTDNQFTKQVKSWEDIESVARALPQGQNVQIRVEKPAQQLQRPLIMHHAKSEEIQTKNMLMTDDETRKAALASKSMTMEEYQVKTFFDDLEADEPLQNYSTDLDPSYYNMIIQGQIPCSLCKGNQDILCNLCLGLDKIELSEDFLLLKDHILNSTDKLYQKVLASSASQVTKMNRTVPAFQGTELNDFSLNDTRKPETAALDEDKPPRLLSNQTVSLAPKLFQLSEVAAEFDSPTWDHEGPPREVSSFDEELEQSEDDMTAKHAEAAFRKLDNRQKSNKNMSKKSVVNRKSGTSPKHNTTLARQKTSEIVQQRKETQQNKVQSSLRKKTEDYIYIDPENELQRINLSLIMPETEKSFRPTLKLTKTIDDMTSLSKTYSIPKSESCCGRNICEGCGGQNLIGSVYKCEACEDFELCEVCYMDKGNFHDPSHRFIQAISELSQSIRATSSLMGSRIYGGNRRNSKFVYTYEVFQMNNLTVTQDCLDIMLQLRNTSGEPFPDDVIARCREEHMQPGDTKIGHLAPENSKIITVSLLRKELKFERRTVTIDFEVLSLTSSHKHFANFRIKLGHPEYNKEIYYIEDVSIDPYRHKRILAEAKQKCDNPNRFTQLLKTH